MARTPWILRDTSSGTAVDFLFPINPNQFTPPARRAGITYQRTTAPNGQALIFQGLDEISEGSFSGIVLTDDFRQELLTQTDKWYPMRLIDDRGNTWRILITEITWNRRHRHINPDTYEYTVKFVRIP